MTSGISLKDFRQKIGEDQYKKLLSTLTVREKIHPGRPKNIIQVIKHAYFIEGNLLYIPRIKKLQLMKIPGLFLSETFPEQITKRFTNIQPQQDLYQYQEAAINFLYETISPNTPCKYLQMDPGLGKTRVGCGLIVKIGEPAIVVAPTDAIANQWVDEFAEIYPELKVAVYHNKDNFNSTTHDVLVVIINTFRNKTQEFLEGFGVVILDEAHEYHSTANCRALWLAQHVPTAIIGLSATPSDRPDGLDRYINLHLGEVILPSNIPGFDAGKVNFKCEVHAIKYTGIPEYCETALNPAGMMSAILTIGRLIKDPVRLNMLAKEAYRIFTLHETKDAASYGLGPRPASAASEKFPEGEIRRHGIFIFAEHRDFLPIIKEALLKVFNSDVILIPEMNILRGGVHKDAVKDARKAGAHIVLTTYGFSRRGISLPEMTAIIAATPRRNGMRQILGRIFRRGSDESIVRIFTDIIDVGTGLKGQFTDRKKIYVDKGFKIITSALASADASADLSTSANANVSVNADVSASADLSLLSNKELLEMVYEF
jgi:hypothetical protein